MVTRFTAAVLAGAWTGIDLPEITVVSSRPLNEASNGPEKKDAEPKKHRPLTKSKSVAVPPKPHEDTLIVGVDIPPPPSTSPPPRPKSAVPPSTSRRNSNKAPRPRSESFSGFESGDYFDSKDSAMEKDSCQEKELHLQLGRTQSLHSPREPATLPKRIPVRPAPAPPQRNVSLGGINQPQLSPTRPAPPLPLHKSQRDNTNQESTTRDGSLSTTPTDAPRVSPSSTTPYDVNKIPTEPEKSQRTYKPTILTAASTLPVRNKRDINQKENQRKRLSASMSFDHVEVRHSVHGELQYVPRRKEMRTFSMKSNKKRRSEPVIPQDAITIQQVSPGQATILPEPVDVAVVTDLKQDAEVTGSQKELRSFSPLRATAAQSQAVKDNDEEVSSDSEGIHSITLKRSSTLPPKHVSYGEVDDPSNLFGNDSNNEKNQKWRAVEPIKEFRTFSIGRRKVEANSALQSSTKVLNNEAESTPLSLKNLEQKSSNIESNDQTSAPTLPNGTSHGIDLKMSATKRQPVAIEGGSAIVKQTDLPSPKNGEKVRQIKSQESVDRHHHENKESKETKPAKAPPPLKPKPKPKVPKKSITNNSAPVIRSNDNGPPPPIPQREALSKRDTVCDDTSSTLVGKINDPGCTDGRPPSPKEVVVDKETVCNDNDIHAPVEEKLKKPYPLIIKTKKTKNVQRTVEKDSNALANEIVKDKQEVNVTVASRTRADSAEESLPCNVNLTDGKMIASAATANPDKSVMSFNSMDSGTNTSTGDSKLSQSGGMSDAQIDSEVSTETLGQDFDSSRDSNPLPPSDQTSKTMTTYKNSEHEVDNISLCSVDTISSDISTRRYSESVTAASATMPYGGHVTKQRKKPPAIAPPPYSSHKERRTVKPARPLPPATSNKSLKRRSKSLYTRRPQSSPPSTPPPPPKDLQEETDGNAPPLPPRSPASNSGSSGDSAGKETKRFSFDFRHIELDTDSQKLPPCPENSAIEEDPSSDLSHRGGNVSHTSVEVDSPKIPPPRPPKPSTLKKKKPAENEAEQKNNDTLERDQKVNETSLERDQQVNETSLELIKEKAVTDHTKERVRTSSLSAVEPVQTIVKGAIKDDIAVDKQNKTIMSIDPTTTEKRVVPTQKDLENVDKPRHLKNKPVHLGLTNKEGGLEVKEKPRKVPQKPTRTSSLKKEKRTIEVSKSAKRNDEETELERPPFLRSHSMPISDVSKVAVIKTNDDQNYSFYTLKTDKEKKRKPCPPKPARTFSCVRINKQGLEPVTDLSNTSTVKNASTEASTHAKPPRPQKAPAVDESDVAELRTLERSAETKSGVPADSHKPPRPEKGPQADEQVLNESKNIRVKTSGQESLLTDKHDKVNPSTNVVLNGGETVPQTDNTNVMLINDKRDHNVDVTKITPSRPKSAPGVNKSVASCTNDGVKLPGAKVCLTGAENESSKQLTTDNDAGSSKLPITLSGMLTDISEVPSSRTETTERKTSKPPKLPPPVARKPTSKRSIEKPNVAEASNVSELPSPKASKVALHNVSDVSQPKVSKVPPPKPARPLSFCGDSKTPKTTVMKIVTENLTETKKVPPRPANPPIMLNKTDIDKTSQNTNGVNLNRNSLVRIFDSAIEELDLELENANGKEKLMDKLRKSMEFSEPNAIAVYDYQSDNPDDLSFQIGDIIMLHSRVNKEWYHGSFGDKQGMFPSSFVEVLVELPEDVSETKQESSAPGSFNQLECPHAIALHNYVASRESELSFECGDMIQLLRDIGNGFLEGSCNGCKGVFPTSFVAVIKPLTEFTEVVPDVSQNIIDSRKIKQEITQEVKRTRLKAIYDYKSNIDADLNFSKGEIIIFLEIVDDDWMKGELKGKTGIFPTSYVQKLEDPPSCGMVEGSSLLEMGTSLFDFEGDGPDELSFKAGNVLVLTGKANGDWFFGECAGQKGLIPVSAVEIDNSSSDSGTDVEAGRLQRTDSVLSPVPEEAEALQPRATALFDFEPIESGELSFKTGDVIILKEMLEDNWYLGELSGKEGKFPSAFVEVITPLPLD